MKTMILKSALTVVMILFVFGANATVRIDERRVYNPIGVEGLESFSGKISHVNSQRNNYDATEIAEVELAVKNWMHGVTSPSYMKDLDSLKFYWQFVESPHYDPTRIGVIIVIPHEGISKDFYTTLAGGLEMPASRCYGAEFAWINNGEIISFLVDKENMEVEEFKNWRFQHRHSLEDITSAYYSQMIINYKTSGDLSNVKLFHFVDGEMRAEIPVQAEEKIYFPKGRFSTLVFYIGSEIKGVMCFDMVNMSQDCPMNFESTVYLKERLGYEKVLYAEPLCAGTYSFELIDKGDFEALTTIDWQDLIDLPGIATF